MRLSLFNEISETSLAIAEMIHRAFMEDMTTFDGWSLTLCAKFELGQIVFEVQKDEAQMFDERGHLGGELTADYTDIRIYIKDEEKERKGEFRHYGEEVNDGIITIILSTSLPSNSEYAERVEVIRKVEIANPKMIEILQQYIIELGELAIT